MAQSLNKILLEKLECPSCLEYMIQMIYICETGHSLCQNCTNTLKHCPICSNSVTEIRNFDLEAVAEDLHYPCLNEGCPDFINPNAYDEHLLNCDFRLYPCIFNLENGMCPWAGPRSAIYDHVENNHRSKTWMHEESINRWKVFFDAQEDVQLVQAFGEIFYFHRCHVKEDNTMYWAVQYIGPIEKASYYGWTIILNKEPNHSEKITISDICENDRTSMNQMIQEGKCSGVPINVLENFQNKYGKVFYRVKITNFNE